jgi:hypothetical protein
MSKSRMMKWAAGTMHALWNMHTFCKQTWKENFRNLGLVGESFLKFTLEEEGGNWGLRCSRNNVVSCWAEEQFFQVNVEFSVKKFELYSSCTQWINMLAARFPWERPRRCCIMRLTDPRNRRSAGDGQTRAKVGWPPTHSPLSSAT